MSDRADRPGGWAAARRGRADEPRASHLLTVVAMAGLGFGVELRAIGKVGPRVGVAVVASLLFLATLTVVLLRLLAIG